MKYNIDTFLLLLVCNSHDKHLYIPDICFSVINLMHVALFCQYLLLSVEHSYRITVHIFYFLCVNFKLKGCFQIK